MIIDENAIELTGKESGPTSIIISGVHGDEVGGINAFQEILPSLTIEKGKVIFMYGNPKAIAANKRFTDTNLNRMFKEDSEISESDKKSYEYGRAQFIKKYLDQATALLDIHSSFTPQSQPFIIAEPNSRELTKFLPFNLVVSGFDTVEPGGTDTYMNEKGDIGICIECGYLGDASTQNIAKDSIYSFLKLRGHITGSVEMIDQSSIAMNDLYYTKTDKFVLSKEFKDFEELKKDQIIGLDGNEAVLAKKDGVILFARNRSIAGDEAFLYGEYIKNLV